MAVDLMPLGVITTGKRATTTVTELHQRKNKPSNHTETVIHTGRVSLLELPKALIQPAMLVPEAALTPSHRVAGKTTTVADEIRSLKKRHYYVVQT